MKKLEDKLVPKGPGVTRYLALPKSGWTDEQVKAELQKSVSSPSPPLPSPPPFPSYPSQSVFSMWW